ncbi:DNA polymerase III subunit delta' [Shewanella sp. Isolate11]|uniref:DNA polymerase III subunit delta' n=1 Tax=Shewanella sp. Isolate11 TaxID=2908530 RepID=UPI001EFED4F6|nr:DNA polymerase III subunit delta' [Shewanella sp. Isolate11]MCG9696994.1 DNA polymerase III subunit delta' [Shewanella sp. Isolate11]
MNVIPWHQAVIAQFSQQLNSGLQGHAYLVGMHQGYGGIELTQTLAKLALCLSPESTGACGQCKPCQLFAAGSHPDFYVVEADGNQIKVDQIRELCQSLTATAQQGGKRVAIIYHAERLNTAAANALLKTLEEPGKDTLLLLQTDTPGRLVATISSRCQRLHFKLPNIAEIQQWLQQHHQLSADVTWCLPVMGGPTELLSALQSERYADLIHLRKQWVQSLSSGHLCASLSNIDQKQVSDALKVLYLVLRQKLIKQKSADALINAKISDFAAKVMTTYHELSMMPNMNYMAIFQSFILEYQSLNKS